LSSIEGFLWAPNTTLFAAVLMCERGAKC